ncbi:hypothetical protein HRbin29_01140 [bacterium HR29]|jgi:hypothetical protein|nr:hypothetical protein HRbin29_01140 [bacterium HR29]
MRSRRWLRRALTTSALLVLIFAAYAAAMQATLPDEGAPPLPREERDRLHAAIHAGALLLAFLGGWALGWAEERNGFAYAVTVTVTLAFLMAFALIASRELACSPAGVVVLREWTCR